MTRQTIRRYSEAFKRQVVSEYEAGASCQKLSQKYGITGKNTVTGWVRRYATQGLRQELVVIQRPEERHELHSLKQRLRDLEQVVAQLSVEKIVLQASLDEAEARLGEPVKKKGAAK